MVQIIQITLHEASFTRSLAPGSRALAKLLFGQYQKSFSNFRTIKNQTVKFHGERASLSSQSRSAIRTAYIQMSVIENNTSMDYGRVEIGVAKIRETKDGKRVMMELENNKFKVKFQVLASSFEGSDIDTSQNQQTFLSPIKINPFKLDLNGVKKQQNNILTPQRFPLRASLTQRVFATDTKHSTTTKKTQEKQQPKYNSPKNQVFISNRNDDRNSERPARRSSFRIKNNEQRSGNDSRQSSLNNSIIKKHNSFQTNDKEGFNKKGEGMEKSMTKKVSFVQKPIILYENKLEQHENWKYYGYFAAISMVSFFLGVAVKQM